MGETCYCIRTTTYYDIHAVQKKLSDAASINKRWDDLKLNVLKSAFMALLFEVSVRIAEKAMLAARSLMRDYPDDIYGNIRSEAERYIESCRDFISAVRKKKNRNRYQMVYYLRGIENNRVFVLHANLQDNRSDRIMDFYGMDLINFWLSSGMKNHTFQSQGYSPIFPSDK
jgi:hypothetical protein